MKIKLKVFLVFLINTTIAFGQDEDKATSAPDWVLIGKLLGRVQADYAARDVSLMKMDIEALTKLLGSDSSVYFAGFATGGESGLAYGRADHMLGDVTLLNLNAMKKRLTSGKFLKSNQHLHGLLFNNESLQGFNLPPPSLFGDPQGHQEIYRLPLPEFVSNTICDASAARDVLQSISIDDWNSHLYVADPRALCGIDAVALAGTVHCGDLVLKPSQQLGGHVAVYELQNRSTLYRDSPVFRRGG
jgi:hypothetical protein